MASDQNKVILCKGGKLSYEEIDEDMDFNCRSLYGSRNFAMYYCYVCSRVSIF